MWSCKSCKRYFLQQMEDASEIARNRDRIKELEEKIKEMQEQNSIQYRNSLEDKGE